MRLRCVNLGIFISVIAMLCSGCIDVPHSGGGAAGAAIPAGYRDVTSVEDYFFAVGTGGRIDRIDYDKKVTGFKSPAKENLNAVALIYDKYIAVGNAGTILVSKNLKDFTAVSSGTKNDLLGVAVLNGKILAVGRGGVFLTSEDGDKWQKVDVGVKEDIVSIGASMSRCFAVTREGKIITSTDAKKFTVQDYDKEFRGYNEHRYWFERVNVCGNMFFITGSVQGDEGVPLIMYSDTGEVWMMTSLAEVNGEPLDNILPLKITAIGLNGDQLIASADKGRLISITDCSVCNKMTVLTDVTLNALAYSAERFIVVGDGFKFEIQDPESVRMDDIKAEQALTDQQNGAFIVDVRTVEEYATGHVKGAVHIPVDMVAANIENIIPDKNAKIIFYCAKGARAQTALTTARDLGYTRVYNLGGISDWPYDTEKGSIGAFK